MSGPQRNPDSINTVGIVVIGICAAVLVYVTITALQAFYMKDTADVQTMADYGGNDTNVRRTKAEALGHISESGTNRDKNNNITSYRIPIQSAMAAVVEQANAPGEKKLDSFIPGITSNCSTAQAQFGRPLPLEVDCHGKPIGNGSAAGSGSAAAGSGSATAEAPATGSGSAAGSSAPQTPTGGQGQGGGPAPAAGTNNAPAANGSNSPAQGSANGSAAKAPTP